MPNQSTKQRPTKEEYFIEMAQLVSSRATCCRRKVGCVLVDNTGHVLSTGYNGVPTGFKHCEEGSECLGASFPSGEGLDACEAVHAEQNAMLQCKDISLIHTAYVTTAPCMHCTKMLLNIPCERVIYMQDYDKSGKALWKKSKRKWLGIGQFLIN